MKNFKKLNQLVALVAIVFFAASCENDQMVAPEAQSLAKMNNPTDADLNARKIKDDPSIAEIAIQNEFTELVAALAYVDEELDAGLIPLFSEGTDQYTVFAPTNMAFENLYSALGIDEISDLPAELVLDVLFYHVTEGRRASNSVVPKKKQRIIETLLGETFAVNKDLSIDAIGNSANIVAADFSASNGIVHVIDAVILPIE